MPAPKNTPLYVHIPFCVHKCPYCDFFSLDGAGQDQAALVETLLEEARHTAPEAPSTVFLGGGTPSYLEAEHLGRLLDGLDSICHFRRSATEVTAECNPESLDSAKADTMAELGINRLSIGVQSLDPGSLSFFERPHSPEEALTAIEAARASDIKSFSVDMIHGAPGESAATFSHNLLSILELKPNHISAYGLIYEPGTPLHARLERGEFTAQDEDQELENLAVTHSALTKAGMARYEVSNYSVKGYQSSHNVNYWNNGSYIGIGPSAVSHVQGTRYGNHRSLTRWTDFVRSGCSQPNWSETLSPQARLGESWWLGLRLTEGVDPNRVRAVAHWTDPLDPAQDLADQICSEGLLERVGAHYRLTEKGIPLADYVGRRFLAKPDES